MSLGIDGSGVKVQHSSVPLCYAHVVVLSRHQAKFFKYVRTFSVCSRSRVNVAESFLGHRSLGAQDGKGSLSGVLGQRWWHSLWRTEVAERRS